MDKTFTIPRFPGRRNGTQPTHKIKARQRRSMRTKLARAAQQRHDKYQLKGII
ncbi:hypothetical protein [Glutamicibacter sp. TV12E]|uniref:hypothetical protein n=1 Tax=Glutamicibacter sp. TV12E TaxID=3446362 RepID=UPI00403362F7